MKSLFKEKILLRNILFKAKLLINCFQRRPIGSYLESYYLEKACWAALQELHRCTNIAHTLEKKYLILRGSCSKSLLWGWKAKTQLELTTKNTVTSLKLQSGTDIVLWHQFLLIHFFVFYTPVKLTLHQFHSM